MMNHRQREALKSVLDYMWEDESRDYEEQDTEGQENHIYLHLWTLSDYLDTTEASDDNE